MSEAKKPKATNFAAGLKELEAIAAWFESDEFDLDKGLAKFERGLQLTAELKDYLSKVENRVEKLKDQFKLPPTNSNPDLFG